MDMKLARLQTQMGHVIRGKKLEGDDHERFLSDVHDLMNYGALLAMNFRQGITGLETFGVRVEEEPEEKLDGLLRHWKLERKEGGVIIDWVDTKRQPYMAYSIDSECWPEFYVNSGGAGGSALCHGGSALCHGGTGLHLVLNGEIVKSWPEEFEKDG